MRMLPKSNKDQVYIWIDAPRSTTVDATEKIEEATSNFILGKVAPLPENLRIAESVSSSVGDMFMPDFSNLFR